MKRRPHTVKYRRKREGKTNYKKRLKLLEGNKPRLVIRKTLKQITIQITQYEAKGDKILLGVNSNGLSKFGWDLNKKNLPSCYLTGLLLGKKAKEKGVKEAILDIGLNPSIKGSRIYTALKGVIDAGLKVPFSDNILPDEKRLKGEHLKNVGKKFEDVKNKIMGGETK